MNPLATLVAAVLASGIATGCYTGGDVVTISAESVAPRASEDASQVASTSVSGLPCDVAAVLASSCASCHGAVPSAGAPNAMLTYEDLVAPSLSDPSRTVAELAVARMQDAQRPMPPTGASAADAAVFAAWIAGGSSKGACDTSGAL
jgi:mono/diheme cytochrome c family protein